MITYRTVKTKEDAELVTKYCDANNLLNPVLSPSSTTFIAVNENGEIVGISAVRTIVQIEPLISANPMIAHILGEKAITAASLVTKEVIAVTKSENEKWISSLELYGFKVTDKNMTMLRRDV